MKRIIFIFIFIFWYLTLQAQTVIAKQSFEDSGDTWTPLNFSTPPCNNNNDIWDYVTSLPSISPNEGAQFWGIRDLDGNCGGNGFETIIFPNTDVSSFTNVNFSFDYNAINFDNNEDLKYELFYNGVSQGEVIVVNGQSGTNVDNTNGWLTETISIPSVVNSVSVILSARCNRGNERAGFDNVILTEAAPSQCDNATPLVVYSNGTSSGNEIGADSSTTTPSSMSNTSCDSFTSNENLDIFYSFTVPSGATSINVLTAGATGSNINLAVWDACNGNEVFCDNTDSAFHEVTGLTSGQTYILQVWHDDFNAGPFTIALEGPVPPPANSDCFDALELTVGTSNSENLVTSTNEGASNSGELPNPTCGNYGGRDVWFTTQVPASGILTVETLSAGSNIDPAMAIYTGTCGNLTELDCNDDINWPSNPYSQINITGLPNTTIYVRVYSYNNQSTGNFNIVAYSPECPFTTTWNGNSWNNGTPNSFTSAIINGDYDTAFNGSFDSCNCDINNGSTVNIRANNYISIENDLTVNGILEVRHEGSLVMVEDDGIVTAPGTINVHKTTTPLNEYDYAYWSSPSKNITLGNAFSSYNADRTWSWNNLNGWINTTSNTVMETGKGYVVSVDNVGPFPKVMSPIFNGIVNNGIIKTPVETGTIDYSYWNIIGNPYPSAINADLFLNDPMNASIISGTIYIWTHNTPISEDNPGDERYNYSVNDYATYTAGTGGVSAISGGDPPNEFIATGQAFLIEAFSSDDVTYNNSMREKFNNNQFFKSGAPASKNRIWLDLYNDKGAFSEILIGFIDGASNDFDRYDGLSINSGYVAFYSIVNDNYLAVQGKKPILNEITNVTKLGFYNSIEGADSLKISIHKFEGILDEYNIYLKDNDLNIVHDLKVETYNFLPQSKGVFNDRFELILTKPQVLDVEEITTVENKLLALQGNTSVEIKTTNTNIITQLKVYDLLGKTILDIKPNSTSYSLKNNSIAKGTILLLSATLDTNELLTKKIIIP